jgi:hypothetical protein
MWMGEPEGWEYRVIAIGLGLLFTLGAVLSALDSRPPTAYGNGLTLLYGFLFGCAAAANLCLAYAAVSWCLSRSSVGILAGLAAAVGWALVLGVCWRVLFPWRWTAAWQSLARALEPIRPLERDNLGWWLLFLAFPLVLLLLMFLPPVASPVPLALCVLSGVVSVYGWFTYAVRRRLVVLVAFLALLALFSHLQPYKMRFGDLDDWYVPDQMALVDLEDAVEKDGERQRQFDEALDAYLQDKFRIERLKASTQLEEGVSPDAVAAFLRLLDRLAATYEKPLRDQWRCMEEKNRIRAARFSPTHAAGMPALRQAITTPPLGAKAVSDFTLLRAEDLHVHPVTQREPRKNQKPTLVVVAVSGGGIRAAVWTFTVLAALEQGFAEQGIDFPAHLRLITGASGGMVGAAYYVATLPRPEDRPPSLAGPRARDTRSEHLVAQRESLSQDFLTPLVRRAILTDLPGWLSPWPLKHDRGRALEEAWSRHLKDPRRPRCAGALEQTFEQMLPGEREGWRPSLVFTPMMIEDGRRILISNLDLREPLSNDGRVLLSRDSVFPDNHSYEALELFRLFWQDGRSEGVQGKLRLATAARMSASFPYFSPAVSLPTRPRRRVVDAGYYDNYGVGLAAAWLFSGSSREWVRANFDRILFLQIRDGLTEEERQLRKLVEYSTTSLTRSAEELTSPPEGLYSAGFAASSFRNDGQLALLDKFDALSRDRARWEERFRRFSTDPIQLQRQLDALKVGLAAQAAAAQALVAPSPGASGLPLGALALGSIPAPGVVPLPDEFQAAALSVIRVLSGPESTRKNWEDSPFLVANFELDQQASTSWYLSCREQKAIETRTEEHVKTKIRRILLWWKASARQQ